MGKGAYCVKVALSCHNYLLSCRHLKFWGAFYPTLLYRFLEKITIKKGSLFPIFKGPLQFIKITLHSMGYMGMNCFAKTLLSRYLCVF